MNQKKLLLVAVFFTIMVFILDCSATAKNETIKDVVVATLAVAGLSFYGLAFATENKKS